MCDSVSDKKPFTEQAKLFATAQALHTKLLVVDSHCDTPMCFFDGIDLGKREKRVKVDFRKMEDGEIDAIFMATYIEQADWTKRPLVWLLKRRSTPLQNKCKSHEITSRASNDSNR